MNTITRQAREAAMQRLFEMEMARELAAASMEASEAQLDAAEDTLDAVEQADSASPDAEAEENAPGAVVELRIDDDAAEPVELTDADRDFVNRAADAVKSHAKETDEAIEKSLIRWTLGRLSRVDLAILRLAVAEMEYLKTPPKIAINEAVELAKKYSGDKSHQFVNGVLAGYLKGRSS